MIKPNAAEIAANPRARWARLRAAERLPCQDRPACSKVKRRVPNGGAPREHGLPCHLSAAIGRCGRGDIPAEIAVRNVEGELGKVQAQIARERGDCTRLARTSNI